MAPTDRAILAVLCSRCVTQVCRLYDNRVLNLRLRPTSVCRVALRVYRLLPAAFLLVG